MNNVYGPREIKINDLLITTAGSFISGLIGSIILLLLVGLIGVVIDIPGNFNNKNLIGGGSVIFPFVLSFVTFISSISVSIISYNFFVITDPNKYKKTIIHFGQVSFYSILLYIILAPVYIYTGTENYNNIMIVFIIHSLLLSFGISIILETLNNYRYILLGIYASLIGLVISGVINFYIFSLFSDGYAKLISLLLIFPLINGLITFFKGLFELLYYKYFLYSGLDQLGDIFKQIEQEELEELNDISNQNTTY